MIIIYLISLLFCRFLAGYDSRFQSSKYIIIKNPNLRKLLVDELSFFERKKRLKKDISKMTVSGLVLYVFSFFTIVVSAILYFAMPKTQIDTLGIETNNFFMNVDTLNEKLASICIWLFFLALNICLAIRIIRDIKTFKDKWIIILSFIISFAMIIVAIFIMIFMVKEFLVCFSI